MTKSERSSPFCQSKIHKFILEEWILVIYNKNEG